MFPTPPVLERSVYDQTEPVRLPSKPRRRRLRRPTRRRELVRREDAVQPLLVDVMSTRQRWQFRFLVSAWAAGIAVFYLWWLRLEHVLGWLDFAVNTLLITWSLALPGYFLFFVSRMKRVNPKLALPPDWRVAMVTTRAPSEPIAVVQETLEAMLAQEYPHDTWLADEDPSDEIFDWCQRHGVQVSTRKGVAEYHRDSWPRRTKCKEGNLAYFYDHYGYERYDYVVQLDADHVPQQGYLDEMLKPFVDPAVGYVSAPSICSKQSETSWSARGRLFSESLMHGPLQAGYSAGFAPLCIGSHYAVRTRALLDIGGLGPELAEDHSTTLMMNGHGWRGVHALDAIAIGEGPPTLTACITQEFQWSRSLTVVMLTVMPRYWSRLPWRLRFQFLFSEMWYPLFSATMLCGLSLPVIAVMSKEPFVHVGYIDFLLHVIPPLTLMVAVQAFLKRGGWLRPDQSPLFRWEIGLFQIVRWPWAAYGVLMGGVMSVRRRSVQFLVTPKGAQHAISLPWKILLPYIVVLILTYLPSLMVDDAGAARGYYFFLIMGQITYLVALFCVVLIHRNEIERKNDG